MNHQYTTTIISEKHRCKLTTAVIISQSSQLNSRSTGDKWLSAWLSRTGKWWRVQWQWVWGITVNVTLSYLISWQPLLRHLHVYHTCHMHNILYCSNSHNLRKLTVTKPAAANKPPAETVWHVPANVRNGHITNMLMNIVHLIKLPPDILY